MHKKFGFTLAEVLIVLGVVGIIAAITLPSLITNYKVKVLKARFQKADAVLQQALLKTANEVGYDSFLDLYIPPTSSNDELNRMLPEINKAWEKQFDGATKYTNQESYLQLSQIPFNNIFGEPQYSYWAQFPVTYGDNRVIITKDGTAFSYFGIAGSSGWRYLLLRFDTNGPFKGPNRVGHDIFNFQSKDLDINRDCNPGNRGYSFSTYRCYYWAHRNINPIDNSKPYWDILYKPLSYWQKKDK